MIYLTIVAILIALATLKWNSKSNDYIGDINTEEEKLWTPIILIMLVGVLGVLIWG